MSQYTRNYNRPGGGRRPRYAPKNRLPKFLILIASISIIIGLSLLVIPHGDSSGEATGKVKSQEALSLNIKYDEPEIQAELLDSNPYSRPQTPLNEVKGVVVHYVGNPGTSAQANRNYFNGLAQSGATYASSHFIIDLNGTIVQCIPLNEMSYASNDRNKDTISIEVCHPDETGKFTTASYHALVDLVRWLCSKYNLSSDDVIRHYDVTGKLCPLYYVEHEDAWLAFKKDVFK